MRCNETNRNHLREFLMKVRTQRGLGIVEFAPLIGLKYSIWQQIEDGSKRLGSRSLRKIAAAVNLSQDIVAAILDREALPVRLPSPESVRLTGWVATIPDILIDFETASKMRDLVNTAGPLPLSELIQPFVK